MRSSTALCLLLAALTVAGCGNVGARGKETFTAKNENGDTLYCHQEYPTGSHIGRTVCRTEQQMFDEREKSREFVNRPVPKLPERPTSRGGR